MAPYDAVVVGAGVIGLTTAWRLAERGLEVAIVDPAPGRGASWVAAGMLAPVTEAGWGEEDLLELNIRAARSWPGFAADLERLVGEPSGYLARGTLLVGANDSDRAFLEELLAFQSHLGLRATWCRPSACRELEPLLAPGIRGGIHAPDDHQVDNRLLLRALHAAVKRAGVTHLPFPAGEVCTTAGRVSGLRVGEETLGADVVVLAAGHASGDYPGLPPALRPPVRPVKGEILRLGAPRAAPGLRTTVRAIVEGSSIYVVARADGRVVVGATVQELIDTAATAGGVYALLRDATRVLPSLLELDLEEASAGLRPGSPDNVPLVGPSGLEGLLFATGHYRNGILLAPLTAEVIAATVTGDGPPGWARAFDPGRFARPEIDRLGAR